MKAFSIPFPGGEAFSFSPDVLESLERALHYGLWVTDAEGRNLYLSPRFREVLGLGPEAGDQPDWHAMLHPDEREKIRAGWLRALATGEPWQEEIRFRGADGRWHPVLSRGVPVRDAAGKIGQWVGFNLDITRFDTAAAALRAGGEAARRLAAIVESSEDAIISTDLRGTITSWNQGAVRLYGYEKAEILGQPLARLIPEERQDEEPALLARVAAGQRIETFETVRRRKDGTPVDVSLTVSAIRGADGAIIGVSKSARDITARKRLEERQQALYELMDRVNRSDALEEIYEAALNAVGRCYKITRAAILLWEEPHGMRFRAWRGLSEAYRAAAEGHSPWGPEEVEPAPRLLHDVEKAEVPPRLAEAIRHEGIRSLAFIPITYQRRLIGKFMLYHEEPHRFSAADLQPAQTIATQVAFAIERRRTGEALERLVNERTASLRQAVAQMEEFSYSVSHDLRAPVRAMQGYAKAVLEDYGDRLDDDGREYLERIVRNGTRMDRMIQDILAYSRLTRREMPLQPVDLDRLVREIIQQYPNMQAPQVRIELAARLDPVMGHEPSLSQAISNLLGNAVKFVRPGQVPEVRLHTERRGREVRLWIEDRGIGIRPEYQSRLFAMFDRLHPELNYEGNGIGLAIVRKAMERMNGSTGVESDGVTGSRFWIQLPAVEG